MTPRNLFLTVSLLANAALLVAYVAMPAAPQSTTKSASDKAASTSASESKASAIHSSTAPGATNSATVTTQKAGFSWAAIETNDLDELSRRLKAAGFTPREVRSILARQIDRMSRPAGAASAPPTPYWQAGGTDYTDPKAREAMRKRNAENMRLHQKYVMGPESLADDPDRQEAARRQWGNLPLEKLQALAAIDADYQDLSMKQYAEQRARPGEKSNAADAASLMRKERLADIAKVLTPEEYAEFELRGGDTANALRFRLEGFQATEQEFKTILAIQKAYESRRDDPKFQLMNETEAFAAYKALQDEITAKVKDALGADRALDYDAVTNINNNSRDQTALLISRLGLPARVAVEVRQAQQDFTQRGKEIRANPQLAPAERNAQLATLAQQAATQLTAKLGTDGFEAYSDLKGDWIRALTKPSTGKP